MDKHLSISGPEKARLIGIPPGQERFVFLYVVVAFITLAVVMTCSGIAGLSTGKTLMMLIGALIVTFAMLFSVLEVRRLAQKDRDAALVEQPDPYAPHGLVVRPPTGDAYPHHEEYRESQGFDQGQLTSRIPDSTPLVDAFLLRRREKKQRA